jgi:hypothetical protein
MGWIGPVADGQQHEGWVVRLFADGAQGAGTSSARGILIARRPDDGPCDGDRVRLTYRDGTTAESLWSDGTLLRGDGIVHSPTSGQVGLEVIEQAEQWRPDAAVVGWVAGCTCGWRGTPWTRVPAPEAADPAARRLAVTGPWADLEAADENRVRQEWRRHIAGWLPSRRWSRPPPGRPPPPARWTRRCAPHSPPGPRGPTSAGSPAGPAGRQPSRGPPVTEQPTGHPGPSGQTPAGRAVSAKVPEVRA